MKAVVLHEHGGLDQLQIVADFPDPVVVEGHVVIRVGATSFNYHDVFTVRGMPGIKVPFPMIIGLDIAGEILEVGAGVTGWKKGDRVLVNPLNKKKGTDGRDDARRSGREMPGRRGSVDRHAQQSDI